jgi:hypothetical protein
VTLVCMDQRRNRVVLVREPKTRDIYAEVTGIHGDTEVYTLLRLGPLWQLIPKLADLT